MAESVSEQQPQQESCPSPLGWQEVVARFEESAQPWIFQRGHYDWTGRVWGAGPPIYFLNGPLGDCRLFALLTWVLREEFKCVLLDYPTPIKNENVKANKLSLDDWVEDFSAIMDLQCDSQCSLYASSWGTALGLQLLAHHPARISAALFQGVVLSRTWSLAERFLMYLGGRTNRTLGQVPGFRSIQQANHRSWFPPFDSTRMQFFLENVNRTPVKSMVQRVNLFSQECDPIALSAYREPVMLIGTEGEGKLVSRDQAKLLSALPHAQLEMLDNTGSLPHLTHPHRIRKVVQQFLNQSG